MTRRVLVWRGYGITNVYAMDTKEQFENIYQMFVDSYKYYTPDGCKNIFHLINFVEENCQGDDCFDQFELITVKDA